MARPAADGAELPMHVCAELDRVVFLRHPAECATQHLLAECPLQNLSPPHVDVGLARSPGSDAIWLTEVEVVMTPAASADGERHGERISPATSSPYPLLIVEAHRRHV